MWVEEKEDKKTLRISPALGKLTVSDIQEAEVWIILSILTAAATGKELFSADDDRKHVEIDREHSEVVLRFKL